MYGRRKDEEKIGEKEMNEVLHSRMASCSSRILSEPFAQCILFQFRHIKHSNATDPDHPYGDGL